MRSTKPHYITTTTSGVFAFNIAIPTDLRVPGMPAAVLRSLHTRRRAQARALAKTLAGQCFALFEAARAGVHEHATLPERVRSLVDDALRSLLAPAAPLVELATDPALDTFLARVGALWKTPLLLDAEPEPEHPHVHAVLLNPVPPVAYRRRFAAFERGPVQRSRVRRWTVLRHVPSPEHSNLARRLGRPVWFGDYFTSP